MDTKETPLVVLMLPWLAHGHISPFLELAKKLSRKNFSVHFCSTLINLDSIRKKLGGDDENSLSIQLVELHLPSLPDLPPRYHTTNGLPPNLMSTLFGALEMASPAFSNILKTVNPNLLIYESFQPWMPALASSHCIPAVNFIVSGAATMSFFYHYLVNYPSVGKFPFQEIHLRDSEMNDLSRVVRANGLEDKGRALEHIEQFSDIVLIKSCREMEQKYIDYLSVLINKRVVSTGPLVADPVDDDEEERTEMEIMEWLSNKDQSSCVFVSFGSEHFLSEEEIEEMGRGLELSNVNFIWVIRFPAGEGMRRVEEALPRGFVESVKERGMVVEGWAPQVNILRHPSIGGFVSHCGWGSVIESISFGVPVIAMPIKYDQPLNARLVVELGVGVEVTRGENGEFKREEVTKVIKEVVVEKSGEEMRRKARELGEKMRIQGEEDIDCVVEELTKLCKKSNKQ